MAYKNTLMEFIKLKGITPEMLNRVRRTAERKYLQIQQKIDFQIMSEFNNQRKKKETKEVIYNDQMIWMNTFERKIYI